MRRILVTSALPYSNGAIHLGHLLEHIQTDIWTRYQKLRGNECYYVCAEDTHGTATMLSARKQNISPEELVEQARVEHVEDFTAFGIGYDEYYTTHSSENEEIATLIYTKLQEQGTIFQRTIEQLYDPEEKCFLADRYVKGICPKCGALDQPGDNCDACGATYNATDLLEPRSELSNAVPIIKTTAHYFFDLPQFEEFLKDWTTSGTVQTEVSNKLQEWLDGGLKPWDITRDAPYFGFKIPDTEHKYFYVWLDAPIGYMASFKHWCNRSNINFDDFWSKDSECELHHFIGKDIINFHALFWPAVLYCAGFRTPSAVHVHGMVTVNGEKMSKSRGTFINATTFRKHFEPETLRYYYAGRLSPTMADIDINFDDFVTRVNSELVGKLVNIPSRCANFLRKSFNNTLDSKLVDRTLFDEFAGVQLKIQDLYEQGNTRQVVRMVMRLADRVNQYLTEVAPWKLSRTPGKEAEVLQICTLAINLYRTLCVYLKPIVPKLVARSEEFFGGRELQWDDVNQPLLNHRLRDFTPLLQRIEMNQVEAMLNASKQTKSAANEPSTTMIDITDFEKIDLRVAAVLEASLVEGADKLLELVLSIDGTKRTVFAGIREAYNPSDLVGRNVVVVANLKPRKMRFGVSEGMVLAAGPGGKDIFIVSPDEGAEEGMTVR